MIKLVFPVLAVLAWAIGGTPAQADTIAYDAALAGPSGTFYGLGNANNHWTVNTTTGGAELGLRATLPFIGAITPYGDIYAAPLGLSPGNAPRVAWSVAFSFNGAGAGITLGDLSALNATFVDVNNSSTVTVNALGIPDNVGRLGAGPVNAAGSNLTDTAVQNEENLGFPGIVALLDPSFNANVFDTYYVTLSAVCGDSRCGGSGTNLGSVTIQVDAAEPVSLALLGSGLLGLAAVRRRRGG
jgi:hypothetical protein